MENLLIYQQVPKGVDKLVYVHSRQYFATLARTVG